MKYKLLFAIALLLACTANLSFAQNGENSSQRNTLDFEGYTPLRRLQCGLWMNSIGDIAYKTIGCEVDSVSNEIIPSDNYITWMYNIQDSVIEGLSEEDFTARYTSLFRNVVDTFSFHTLSPSFCMDKNHIYLYQDMACGGLFFIAYDLDRATFKVFKGAPDFACDKNSCFVRGRQAYGADPETFRPIATEQHRLLSRDKNHVYEWNLPLSDEEILELEAELGMKLRE